MFTDYENTVVRVAKFWGSPHAGTVPVLLEAFFIHIADIGQNYSLIDIGGVQQTKIVTI